eukprot:SAG31_NODE_3100_length_4675_cov_3.664117_5_plen_82_part_00
MQSDSDQAVAGTEISFTCNTVATLNNDLMSLSEWYGRRNYDLILQHSGFSGLYRRDVNGTMTDLIPVRYDIFRKRTYTQGR